MRSAAAAVLFLVGVGDDVSDTAASAGVLVDSARGLFQGVAYRAGGRGQAVYTFQL